MYSSSKDAKNQITDAIVIPAVVIAVTVLVYGIFGLMHWAAQLADKTAEKSQQNLIGGALQLTQDHLAELQQGVIISQEKKIRLGHTDHQTQTVFSEIALQLDIDYGFTKSIIFNDELLVLYAYAQNHSKKWIEDSLLKELRVPVAKIRARFNSSTLQNSFGTLHLGYAGSNKRQLLSETGIVAVQNRPYLFSASAVLPRANKISTHIKPSAIVVSMVPLQGQKLANISEMSRLDSFLQENAAEDKNSVWGLALTSPLGKEIGFIGWESKPPGTEMMRVINPFMLVAGFLIAATVILVALITRQMTRRLAQSESDAVHASLHDTLSGLPNREQFTRDLRESLDEATVKQTKIAVVYIDLDHFKDINDTLGHSAGDKVIVAIAQRLQGILPETATVARISGDEFAMLIKNCEDDLWLEYILDQAQDEISQPIVIGHNELHASLSMGVAVSPRDGDNPDELLRKADIALYDAKENGRGRRTFFEPNMEHHVKSKDRMSRDLRLALKNDELYLSFQPQSDTSAKRIVSVEALARWTKPDGTEVSPAKFIPVAEETGLINDLGLWVLNKACASAHNWPGIIVSVNVSPNQFKHPRFVKEVMAILSSNSLPPHRLEIEVTESVFAGRNDTVLKSLRKLKSLGVKVALDDFGSGYSSLSYLLRFPFDTLKIDRDFVSDMNGNKEAEAILTSIIQLGKALGMTVVAEGIESIEQIRFLQEHNCNRMQGYFISKPLRAQAVGQFIENFNKSSEGSLHSGTFLHLQRA